MGFNQIYVTSRDDIHRPKATVGALDSGPPCRLSILRNTNVTCLCGLFLPMSPFKFTKVPLSHFAGFFKVMLLVDKLKVAC